MVKYDVITFGSAVVDVYVSGDIFDKGKDICVPSGAKLLIDKLRFSVGGGGTNTAASFATFGLKTAYFGKIGVGSNAEIILKELRKDKVDFIGVQSKEETGYSIILDSKNHNRTVLTHKGANDFIEKKDIKINNLNSKWFYFSTLMKKSFRTQLDIAKYGNKKGIKIAYNPSQYQIENEKSHVKNILKFTDVLIFNKEEAELLVGKKNVFENIHKLGPKIVCVTDGKNGGVVSDGIYTYKYGAHKEIKVVERTGAGDAFASGFITGIIKNKTIEDCIQIGLANSESVIQKPGAKNGLLNLSQAMNKIKNHPVRIEKRKK